MDRRDFLKGAAATIAAVALPLDILASTGNVKDFPIPEKELADKVIALYDKILNLNSDIPEQGKPIVSEKYEGIRKYEKTRSQSDEEGNTVYHINAHITDTNNKRIEYIISLDAVDKIDIADKKKKLHRYGIKIMKIESAEVNPKAPDIKPERTISTVIDQNADGSIDDTLIIKTKSTDTSKIDNPEIFYQNIVADISRILKIQYK